jgi:hypothetical protein
MLELAGRPEFHWGTVGRQLKLYLLSSGVASLEVKYDSAAAGAPSVFQRNSRRIRRT